MSELSEIKDNNEEVLETISKCCLVAIEDVKRLTSENIRLSLELEKYKRKNEELKTQIANSPNTSQKIVVDNFQIKEIKKTTKFKFDIGQNELMLRDVVMAAASHYIKFEIDTDKKEVTATLLVAEVEDV